MNRYKITALYERLSHDDEQKGESNSIINQKKMLLDYAIKQKFPRPLHFTDDGFSGTRFDRPGFISMMEAAYEGRVSVIIVKDMSRIGRDYLKVGELMENLRRHKVRLIALNDHVDTFENDDEFTPFRNIMNEWYARDTSRKIHSALRAKGMTGKHTASSCPYGYLRSGDRWIVDKEAAEVVRRIFQMTIEGKGAYQIAEILKRAGVEMPAVHMARYGQGLFINVKFDDPYKWNATTVSSILKKREYLGHTLNFKTAKHYKDRKSHYLPEEEWVVFENTHEAIVDEETFERVQELRKDVGRGYGISGEGHPLLGRIFCADCWSKMYLFRPAGKENDGRFTCAGYARAPAGTHCPTQHRVSEQLVMEKIRTILQDAKRRAEEDREEFKKEIRKTMGKYNSERIERLKSELAQCRERRDELRGLICRVYEEHIAELIESKRYETLTSSYETELADLEKEMNMKEKLLLKREKNMRGVDRFLILLDKYDSFEELTAPLIGELVEKVLVHERAVKWAKHCDQEVEVYLAGVGRIG